MVLRNRRHSRSGRSWAGAEHSDFVNDSSEPKLSSSSRDSIQLLSHQQSFTPQHTRCQTHDLSGPFHAMDMASEQSRSQQAASPSVGPDNSRSSTTLASIFQANESRIDVEQAISLLQELRKSASPEELVALHRALLPVKEEPQSPVPPLPSIAYTAAPPARKRSVMPPGLATRAGEFQDVLRKPSDPPLLRIPTKSEKRKRLAATHEPVKDSQQRSLSPARPETPSDHAYGHTGAYRAGTLRITNGSASPVPSVRSRLHDSQDSNGTATLDVTSVEARSANKNVENNEIPEVAKSKRDEDVRSTSSTYSELAQTLDINSGETPRMTGQPQADNKQLENHAYQERPRSACSKDNARVQTSDFGIARKPEKSGIVPVASGAACQNATGLTDPGTQRPTNFESATTDTDTYTTGDSQTCTAAHISSHAVSNDVCTVDGEVIGAAQTSDKPLPASSFALPKRTHIVHKMDSGYCSDDARILLHQQARSLVSASIRGPRDMSTGNLLIGNVDALELEDAANDVPSSPVSNNIRPASQSTKKASPLALLILKTKKQDANVNAINSNEKDGDLLCETSAVGSTSEKSRKRLRKPIPDSVRQQQEKEMEESKTVPRRFSMHKGTHSLVGNNDFSEQLPQIVPSVVSESETGAQREESDIAPSSSSWIKRRSKSFGRRHSKTLDEGGEGSASEFSSPPSTFHTQRMHTIIGSRPMPVRSRKDVGESSEGMRSLESRVPWEDPRPPAHTNFASVARALESNLPRQDGDTGVATPQVSTTQKRYYSAGRIGSETRDAVTCNEADLNGFHDDRDIDATRATAALPVVERVDALPAHDRRRFHARSQTYAIGSANSSMVHSTEQRNTMDTPGTVRDDCWNPQRLNSESHSERYARKDSGNRSERLGQSLIPHSDGAVTDQGRSHHQNREWSSEGRGQLLASMDNLQHTSLTHDSQHPGWPNWDRQADLWKQRRESIARQLRSAHEPSDSSTVAVPRAAAASGADNVHNANPAVSDDNMYGAEQWAESYANLISPSHSHPLSRPEVERADSVVSTATVVTMSSSVDGRPIKLDVSRNGRSFSTSTTTTTTTVLQSSRPGEHAAVTRAKHAKAKSVNPAAIPSLHASEADRGGRRSLAFPPSDVHREPPSRPPPRPHPLPHSREDLFDRYGGGLRYGWDRDSGFGGSAGTTRSATSVPDAAPKRNLQSAGTREAFGLDLTDVPVFVRRV